MGMSQSLTFFSGYWNAPETDAREFRGGWLHMGDMFVRNADGSLDFVDRLKSVIMEGRRSRGAVKGIFTRVLDGLGAVGSADAYREQLGAFARAGATPVVLPFAPAGPAAHASLLRTFRAFP